MEYSLKEAIGRFPTLERFERVYLPVTPIPRPISDENGLIMPSIREVNVPVGEDVDLFKDYLFVKRQQLFGIDQTNEFRYSLGDVSAYLVSDTPRIIEGETTLDGFDPYVVRGELEKQEFGNGEIIKQALYQASLARSMVKACVLEIYEESDRVKDYLLRPLVIDPFSEIHIQTDIKDRVVVFSDRQSEVDAQKPKFLSPASTFALLLYRAAIDLKDKNESWILIYTTLFNAMPEEKRVMYDQFVAILRDDQFGGYTYEFRAPGPNREDVLPSDPLYPLLHLNDALYAEKN